MTESEEVLLEEKLRLFERAIERVPGLERKGKTMPYTSLNGYMTWFLTPDGTVGLRLPRDAREEFLRTLDAALMVRHGRVMKEFVEVPESILQDTDELVSYLERSAEYVLALKPI